MAGGALDRLGQWLTFRFEPETAHRMAIAALRSGALPGFDAAADARLATRVAGIDFANPIGVAAGFDKNAEVPGALLRLGFGFTEVGTVTPRAQAGNARPRVFRLVRDRAVINRLGFNNDGHAPARTRLGDLRIAGVVGVNIGANKDSGDRVADYVSGLTEFHDLASYFTVNISSPNTPGLRDLQGRAQLADLLKRLVEARAALTDANTRAVPIFLKIAPDITEADLDDIVAEVLDQRIEGLVVSNTTLSRAGLAADPREAGGLSGRPVFERSTILLAKARERAGPELALIGVGGVDSAASALAKIEAGADLVQLYTGMIYQGPKLPRRIIEGLSEALDTAQAPSIADLRGTRTTQWASKPFPKA